MDPTLIRQKLIETLVRIQVDSGLHCPPIVGGTQPIEELEKFDSKMWPVATGMLSTAIGVEIPVTMNIFRIKGTKTAMTIDETVALVCKLATPQAVAA
jgi:hypothetical protein